MRMAQRLSDSLCASMTFPDLRRLRERSVRQSAGAEPPFFTLHSAPLCDNSVILLPCGVSHTGKCTSDCCLPFPCIHAQTMQHCQHPHTASKFSNMTWAGQQSATLCLWCSRMKTTNVFRHLLELQNPHLTIFCTYNKTFICEVILHACQSLSSSYDH
jgi:hypothetical protein